MATKAKDPAVEGPGLSYSVTRTRTMHYVYVVIVPGECQTLTSRARMTTGRR